MPGSPTRRKRRPAGKSVFEARPKLSQLRLTADEDAWPGLGRGLDRGLDRS